MQKSQTKSSTSLFHDGAAVLVQEDFDDGLQACQTLDRWFGRYIHHDAMNEFGIVEIPKKEHLPQNGYRGSSSKACDRTFLNTGSRLDQLSGMVGSEPAPKLPLPQTHNRASAPSAPDAGGAEHVLLPPVGRHTSALEGKVRKSSMSDIPELEKLKLEIPP